MAKTKISEFSATPANNTDIDSINIAEGCAPSGINDAIRELMAQLKDFQTGAVGDSFNGPVGTSTAAAGAFTTLSASSTVSGTGFSTYLASPPAIGGTAAAAGAFTTLAASGNLTLSGGTANGVAYLNGSKVLTSGSAITFSGQQFAISSLGDQIKISNSVGNQLLTLSSNSAGSVFTSHDGTNFVPILWQSNTAELMRLTSTGLGIGTSSPSQKLHVVAAGGYNATFSENSSNKVRLQFYVDGNEAALVSGYDTTAKPMTFYTGGSLRATLDSSGNLGLGVTPSAWGSTRALQVNRVAVASVGGTGKFATNWYNDGTDRYLTTDFASLYQQNDGQHRFYTAPSGTAGNAITFTQAMTLDASGRLLVGTTSSIGTAVVSKFQTVGTQSFITTNNEAGSFVGVNSNADNSLAISADPDNLRSGSYISFQVDGLSEKARIDSSGNFLVGTTSAGAGLGYATRIAVDGGGGEASVFKTSAGTGAYCSRMWNSATSGNNVFINFQTEAGGTDRGSITYNRAGGLTAYNTTSDYRAKDISGPVTGSGALIDSTPVYMGKMKGATQERPMFIAHETPSYAHTGEKDAVDEDGNPVYQQMDASALIPVMWAEIQSLRKRLADAGIA